MKTSHIKHNFVYISLFILVSTTFFLSCSGRRSSKVQGTDSEQLQYELSDTGQSKNTNTTTTQPSSSQGEKATSSYKQPEIIIQRKFSGKDVQLALNPEHRGGEGWNAVWEEELEYNGQRRLNRIVQLSPTVLLYRRFPKEVAKDFYYLDQPDKIEFLDSTFNTISTIDIWKNRPYRDIKNAKLTYWNFDGEGMGVIPYTEQNVPVTPNEYSLFTDVRSEGNHVVVNYELRSIKNVKSLDSGDFSSDVVAVKHTLHIYDLKGNLKYELKDLRSVDGAVVSNDGRYMMYIFGGMGLANANSPFATIERSGWGLLRLEDQKVVYSEYTDDGILAFNRIWIHYGFPKISYSTPSDKIDYDYWIYFEARSELIYTYKLTQKDREYLRDQFRKTNKVDVLLQFETFNFNKIPVSEK